MTCSHSHDRGRCVDRRRRHRPDRAKPGPTRLLPAVIRSEWTKLRSVRSTVWSLVATFGITVGFGVLLSWAYISRYDRLSLRERFTFDPTAHSLRGLFLAQLAIGVLGVLIMTSEYTTGLIRTTFTAVPQRRSVLAAKAIVFGAAAFVVSMVSVFVAFFAGQAILNGKTPWRFARRPQRSPRGPRCRRLPHNGRVFWVSRSARSCAAPRGRSQASSASCSCSHSLPERSRAPGTTTSPNTSPVDSAKPCSTCAPTRRCCPPESHSSLPSDGSPDSLPSPPSSSPGETRNPDPQDAAVT